MLDFRLIESLTDDSSEPTMARVDAALERAMSLKGLELEDAAILLHVKDEAARKLISARAIEVKRRVFGDRVVLFAPLYLSNYCSNGCVYCGFRGSNSGVERRALDAREVAAEARALEAMGFKRVLLVLGEDKRRGLGYIVDSVRAIYRETGMRIVHVNAAPMETDEFVELKRAGVGLYQAFQETYHRQTYERFHPTGPKRDFDYRLGVMDRAMQGGFADVGIGALLGLYDFRFDALSAIAHSKRLYDEFGAHAHTISIPRLRPAENSPLNGAPHPLTDDDLKLVTSVYRLAVPSAGVVASTRESAAMRAELISAGASQLSAASRTDPGGYGAGRSLEQFSTSDRRTLEEVMASIAASGAMPSLCTACYRVGRVGDNFTKLTTSGGMHSFCEANAILTLKEYVLDKRANGSEALLSGAIEKAMGAIDDPALKNKIQEKLAVLASGKRDVFF
jgi:2-iminoacetate synthase